MTEKVDVNSLTESVSLYAKWVKVYSVIVAFSDGSSRVEFVREGDSLAIENHGMTIESVTVDGKALAVDGNGNYAVENVSSDCRVAVTLREGVIDGCVGGIGGADLSVLWILALASSLCLSFARRKN